MGFPNFKRDIKKLSLKLDNQTELKNNKKTYDLIYQIDEYELLRNQNKDYINNLRKAGIKLKHYKKKINGEVKVVYYKLYSSVHKSNNYIDARVSGILNKVIEFEESEMTNESYINILATKDIPKTKKHAFKNKGQVMFEILGSYLCHKQGSNQLIDFKVNDKLTYYDSNELEDYYLKKHLKRKFRRKTDKPLSKWTKRNQSQYKKWKKTNTHKFYQLFKDQRFADSIGNWSYVDGTGTFHYENSDYKVANNLKQYKMDEDSMSDMDSVLCYWLPEQDNPVFFDENIQNISKYIEKI